MNRLDAAIDAILAGDPDRDPWTALCVAAIRWGAAFAEFDNARKRYTAWRDRTQEPPTEPAASTEAAQGVPVEPWCGHWIHTLHEPGRFAWDDESNPLMGKGPEVAQQIAEHAKYCSKLQPRTAK